MVVFQGGPEIDGVYVKQVQRDSAADQDGRIKKGKASDPHYSSSVLFSPKLY